MIVSRAYCVIKKGTTSGEDFTGNLNFAGYLKRINMEAKFEKCNVVVDWMVKILQESVILEFQFTKKQRKSFKVAEC